MIPLALHGLVPCHDGFWEPCPWLKNPTAAVRRINWGKLKGQMRKIGLVLSSTPILPDLEQYLEPVPPGFSTSNWAVISVICALLS